MTADSRKTRLRVPGRSTFCPAWRPALAKVTAQSLPLEKLLSIPYEAPLAANLPLSPALLRLDPMFEPVRNNTRFQKLVASSAPK
jgi:hypothetical protein